MNNTMNTLTPYTDSKIIRNDEFFMNESSDMVPTMNGYFMNCDERYIKSLFGITGPYSYKTEHSLNGKYIDTVFEGSNGCVAIEYQLGTCDTDHLGQIFEKFMKLLDQKETYFKGIYLIAQSFTQDHINCFRFLNAHNNDWLKVVPYQLIIRKTDTGNSIQLVNVLENEVKRFGSDVTCIPTKKHPSGYVSPSVKNLINEFSNYVQEHKFDSDSYKEIAKHVRPSSKSITIPLNTTGAFIVVSPNFRNADGLITIKYCLQKDKIHPYRECNNVIDYLKKKVNIVRLNDYIPFGNPIVDSTTGVVKCKCAIDKDTFYKIKSKRNEMFRDIVEIIWNIKNMHDSFKKDIHLESINKTLKCPGI